MIKLSSVEEKAFNEGFEEEFLKLAQATSLLKLLLTGLKGIGKHLRISGKLENFATKGLSHLDAKGKATAGFREFMQDSAPTQFLKDKAGKISVRGGKDSGFLGSKFSEAFNYVDDVKRGVKAEKGLFNKTKRTLKNLGSAEAQQYRNATYRIVDTNQPAMFGASKHIVQNGKLKGQAFMPDRKIITDLGGGRYVVKKRMPARLLGWGMTPSAMLATGVLTGGGIPSSLHEAAMWTPATKIIGEASMITSGASMIKGMFGS
jgi:hypothetical protein